MTDISRNSLDAVLKALGEQLVEVGSSVHLVVIGGSGLLALGVVDRPTQDVDVVAVVRDEMFVSADPLPTPVVAAAAVVARDFGLPADWLNAAPTRLLEIGRLPAGFRERTLRRTFGPLTVEFASRFDQVHLKLYALVDRGEPRDASDLRLLDPIAEELLCAARWARTHNAPGPFDDEMATRLRDFGVEDAGRDA